MVIGYVWYSRVCAVSKILSVQFCLVNGKREQLCTWKFPAGPACGLEKLSGMCAEANLAEGV